MSQELKIIISTCIFLLVLAADLITDYRLWKKNKPVNHKVGFIIRSVGLTPIFILLGARSILLVGALYFLLFDGLYNLLRGFNFWFTGSNDKDDATTDNFLQSIPLWAHIALKFALIIVGVIIFIKL